MSWRIITLDLRREEDVVAARRRARDIAEQLGFELQDQTRIATAVSEIARNAISYGRGGRTEFILEEKERPQALLIRIEDRGPGIAQLQEILEGRYTSSTGMGIGLVGARRLMDRFEIDTGASGTLVRMAKTLPRTAPALNQGGLRRIASALASQIPAPFEELRQQDREILQTLEEVRTRSEELELINGELENTNRGVVALHAELEATAEQLRQVSEMKSRFLSNMSHEFRTPLNSILALSRLLIGRTDGPLNDEQEKQVKFIAKAATDLTDLVNDLLDIAKVEAGKLDVRPARFGVHELFSALRGVFRPLQGEQGAQLVFEDPSGLPVLHNDEGKIAQILRNFISNALKFTPAGEVRVGAAFMSPDRVLFSVRDTGIGIAPEFHARIFEEFEQVANPLQARVKGTGLGLPLSRRLARLLKGEVSLESVPGQGSTFFLDVPVRWDAPEAVEGDAAATTAAQLPVLIADDEEAFRYVLRRLIDRDRYDVHEASGGEEALAAIRELRPVAVILDLNMPQGDGYQVLATMQADAELRSIPVIVSTSLILTERDHTRLAGARAVVSKSTLSPELIDSLLADATGAAKAS